MAGRHLPIIHRFEEEQRSDFGASAGPQDYCYVMSCPTLLDFSTLPMYATPTAIRLRTSRPFTQFPGPIFGSILIALPANAPGNIDPRTIPPRLSVMVDCYVCRMCALWRLGGWSGAVRVRVIFAVSYRSGCIDDQALIESSRARACWQQLQERVQLHLKNKLATPGIRDINYKGSLEKLRLWSRPYVCVCYCTVCIHAFSRTSIFDNAAGLAGVTGTYPALQLYILVHANRCVWI